MLVSGGNHPHISRLGTVTAHTLKGTLLQHPQNLNLHVQRHIPDFVQEQGASFGQLKTPYPGGNGAGKGSFLMPEQLALQQLCGNGAAVDRHKRFIPARGMIMQVTGDHFLAGTGFTGDQNADVFISHLLHQLAHLLNLATGAHQTAEQLNTPLLPPLLAATELVVVDLGPVE